ncbi:MAG: arginase family protein [Desulfocapsaceae bacterium]|nr:arginase family protein [Desulfocapsaceae bacterium]
MTSTLQFANLPSKYRELPQSKIVILPIPYSKITEESDHAPQAILDASTSLFLYDHETDSEVYLQGICTMPPLQCPDSPTEMVTAVQQQSVLHFRNDKTVVGLSGSSMVSLGLVQGALDKYRNLSVLHLGAHANLMPSDTPELTPVNIMTEVNKICPSVQIGIRGLERVERTQTHPDRVVFSRDLFRHGINAANDALDILSDRVYLSINLNILDPSSMPSVAKPEPGGIDWYMLTRLIGQVALEKKIVGLDIVGLLPRRGNTAPDYLAAKLVYRVLSMIFSR